MNRKNIKNIMQELEDISAISYNEFEIALVLFLRSNIEDFSGMSEKQLIDLKDLINSCSSIFDLDREDIDNIIDNDYDYMSEED